MFSYFGMKLIQMIENEFLGREIDVTINTFERKPFEMKLIDMLFKPPFMIEKFITFNTTMSRTRHYYYYTSIKQMTS